jgi:FkbM family methyltransferase
MLVKVLSDIVGIGKTMPTSQALAWYSNVIRQFLLIARHRKFYPADRAMTGRVQFRYANKEFEFDLGLLPSDGFSWLREFFVRDNYLCAFDRNALLIRNCVDMGCNVGLVSLILHRLGAEKIVSIDADNYTQSTTRKWILSEAPDICFLRALVSSASNRKFDRDGYSELVKKYGSSFNANKETINCDQIVKMFNGERIDLVKMDIEGAEFDILLDDSRWLKSVDNLTMEVHRDIDNPFKIIRGLRQAGFEVSWKGNHIEKVAPEHADFIYASRNGALARNRRS